MKYIFNFVFAFHCNKNIDFVRLGVSKIHKHGLSPLITLKNFPQNTQMNKGLFDHWVIDIWSIKLFTNTFYSMSYKLWMDQIKILNPRGVPYLWDSNLLWAISLTVPTSEKLVTCNAMKHRHVCFTSTILFSSLSMTSLVMRFMSFQLIKIKVMFTLLSGGWRKLNSCFTGLSITFVETTG